MKLLIQFQILTVPFSTVGVWKCISNSIPQFTRHLITYLCWDQITSHIIVYSTVYSGINQREHQCSASLAFVRGIHRWPVNSPHKWPVTRKMFPFDDVIMHESWTDSTTETFVTEVIRWYLDHHFGHLPLSSDEFKSSTLHEKSNAFTLSMLLVVLTTITSDT